MNSLFTVIIAILTTSLGFLFVSYDAQAATTGNSTQQSGSTTTGSNVNTGISGDKEFQQAVEWAYSYGLTKYKNSKEYKGSELVTREQAAKFYSQFAVNVLYKVIDMTKYCEFTDLKDADPSLRNSILTSCLLHLFNGKQNKFMPLQHITKAEALAVLVRAIDKAQDETTQPRYSNYHKKALELGLTKQTDIKQLEQAVSRYEIALLLYRASQLKK